MNVKRHHLYIEEVICEQLYSAKEEKTICQKSHIIFNIIIFEDAAKTRTTIFV